MRPEHIGTTTQSYKCTYSFRFCCVVLAGPKLTAFTSQALAFSQVSSHSKKK